MGEYTTRPITKSEFNTIITTIKNGFTSIDGKTVRGNNRIATVLVTQANCGMRIGDILNLTMDKIEVVGDKMYLNLYEQKTNKKRTFQIEDRLYFALRKYADNNNIADNRLLFPITRRAVQKVLKQCCDMLGYKNVSTHSFRKYYALNWYEKTNHDINRVMHLLQHTSVTRTQLYLNIQFSDNDAMLKLTSTGIDLI